MSRASLIGLGGYAFSGKDTFADYLTTTRGWAKTFMSRPLHEALLVLNPVVSWDTSIVRYAYAFEECGSDYSKLKENPEVRRLLQVLGTEVGRKQIYENVWIDVAMREVEDLRQKHPGVCVTGIRYRNEIDALHALGGMAVWIERPGFGPVNSHSSDNSLRREDFDHTLTNGYDVPAFYKNLDSWMRTYL